MSTLCLTQQEVRFRLWQLFVRELLPVQITCQQTPARPNSMYGNGAPWPPQHVEPAESLCRACNISRYTFEPPSIFCTSCQQRIKRNQVPAHHQGCLLAGRCGRRSACA